MSDLVDDAEPQGVQHNTWTPLLGTDVEILVDGIDGRVRVESETFREDDGVVLVQFSFTIEPGVRIALRAPVAGSAP
ncbi:hypothetical protein [Spirillospora sp. NPDC047279]|uniref:hypothetical protein n=1 Tax=Spirillospora sp. NPDC047279 TaxID=3155478 RepID=UPI0033CB94CA